MVTACLYIDTSVAMRIALREHDGEMLRATVERLQRSGYRLVSSRLLELECRRVAVRLAHEGRDGGSAEQLVADCDLLDIDEDIWRVAMGITQHVKTLDALHLATAALIPECLLLTSDARMREVAASLGIQCL
ncbi:MAG: type II toxin-antitoxin system VapC family toxin [Cellulomonadaceae bacterium]|jgi:predicted nucleic acid-binding protein|nr:type II toxin-antitoxin system VapC family toxin [Cellulomonadaceae bacterium]